MEDDVVTYPLLKGFMDMGDRICFQVEALIKGFYCGEGSIYSLQSPIQRGNSN
jgi:hypothetical protein